MEDVIIEDNGWYKIMYNPRELSVYITIEYNSDTSAQHPTYKMMRMMIQSDLYGNIQNYRIKNL